MIGSMMMSFDTLVEAGYDPEIVQLELYGSGELVEEIRAVQRYGLLNQLPLHSRTSQYGQLSRISRLVPESTRETLRQVLGDIRSGEFAREWAQVQIDEPQEIEKLNERYAKHPLFGAERMVRAAYGETIDILDSGEDRSHASGDERTSKFG
jgi:ketol-acid reductoisomerase